MALIKKREHSLRTILLSYVVCLTVLSAISSLLILSLFSLSYRFGVLFPANQVESDLHAVRNDIETSKVFNPDVLPDGTSYVFLTRDFKLKKSNMPVNLQEESLLDYQFKNAHGGKYGYFQSFERSDGIVIVNYQLSPRYRNEWMNQHFPNANLLMIGSMMVSILLIFITLTFYYASKLSRELRPILKATEKIAEQDLDFQTSQSTIKEFNQVLSGLDHMRVALRESLMENWKAEQDKQNQISALTHDLKTPLTAIKGYVEGIQDGIADTPQKQEKYLRTIANKVNDMDKLIDELTIYSKLDTNRVPYSFAKIPIKGYFDDCCEEIKIDLEAQGIDLDYRCYAGDDVFIVADAEQLKRVINNIVSNSVKYRDESRKEKITIAVYDEGDYVHILLADNGKGIGARELPRIFERFYRTDSSRNSRQGGSGIGLAIVKKIIEDHKGKIWAESVEGEGTAMHINLLKYKDNSHYCIEDKSGKKSAKGLR